MARIMDIQKTTKMIRVSKKTVMDINYNQKYFSMWVHTAGQESGLSTCPLNVQLDVEMAKRLRSFLTDFIGE